METGVSLAFPFVQLFLQTPGGPRAGRVLGFMLGAQHRKFPRLCSTSALDAGFACAHLFKES